MRQWQRPAASNRTASAADNLVRATIDANVFVSGLLRSDTPPGRVLRAWVSRSFHLVTSRELEDELSAVLARPRFAGYGLTRERVAGILDALAEAEHVSPLLTSPITVRDPKDVKILGCALAGQVDYLVTGDSDLTVLDGDPAIGRLRILTARAFLGALGLE